MTRKIPLDSFEFYVGLGPNRSYAAVAKHFSVAKRSVAKHAAKHGWSRRLLEVERQARERGEERMVNALEEMSERHLKVAKLLQQKALEALRSMAIDTPMGAVRALDLGVRQERLVLGEPTDRNAIAIEDVIRREYQAWLNPSSDSDWDALAEQASDDLADDAPDDEGA